MGDVGFVMGGYVITAVALGGYVVALVARARRARIRAAAIVARRSGGRAKP